MTNTDKNDFNATIGNTVLGDGLLSMTDFIDKYLHTGDAVLQIRTLGRYKDFLKQPLKLEMFVPCDEDGDVLSEPKELDKYCKAEKCNCGNDGEYERDCSFIEYKKSKEKVLFEGFEFVSRTDETWLFKINGNFPRIVGKKLTIESLRIFKDKIKLSQTALNSIFGETVA